MFDLIIKNGTIYDGSGKEDAVKAADIGISGGRVKEIGSLEGAEAKEVIDASGKCVTPGFIDIHGHSESALLVNPEAHSMSHQGITTQINGQCGYSGTPISDRTREDNTRELKEWGLELTWSNMAEYRNTVAKSGIAINHGLLVGHGTVRTCVVGYDAVPATEEQMKEMARLVEESMDGGALGFSTGLQYTPGKYVETEEIIELAKAASRGNGVYSTHMRSEGTNLFEAIDESLRVAREADIPLQIAHLKSSGKANWGKIDQAIEQIESAVEAGVDVNFDRYPYLAGSTGLTIYLHSWVTDGGRKKMLERIESADTRPRIRKELEDGVEKSLGWDRILVASSGGENPPDIYGKTIQEIADERGEAPVDTAMDLLVKGNGSVGICTFSMDQWDTDKVLSHHLCSLCTDACNRSPEGPLSKSRPHPRSYGTFPRFLSEYVRDRKLVPMHEAIRRICSLPAEKYSLKQRGLLKKDYCADVTIFDLPNLKDNARYGDPHHFPSGIDWVIVNGQIVIREGQHTGALPGVVL